MFSPLNEITKSAFEFKKLPLKGFGKFIDSLAGSIRRIRLKIKLKKALEFLNKGKLNHVGVMQRAVILSGLSRKELSDHIIKWGMELKYSFSDNKGLLSKETDPFYELISGLAAGIYKSTGLFPYPEQILCALAVTDGNIAEFATGEGKTISLAMAAAYLWFARGRTIILTANDYLAERDSLFLEKFYALCGLTCSKVLSCHSPDSRKKSYSRDIIYTTAKEYAADFLRDRIYYRDMTSGERRIIRYLFACSLGNTLNTGRSVLETIKTVLIDEVDHLLIDEAVTPLIISQKSRNRVFEKIADKAMDIAAELIEDLDFKINQAVDVIEILPAGEKKIETIVREKDLKKEECLLENPEFAHDIISTALKAVYLVKRDIHYVVLDNKIKIVDPGTGRIMENRSWSRGLHEFVEIKEGLKFSGAKRSITGISFQNFFRNLMFLGGVTGTAWENRKEFWNVYGLAVVRIPCRKACIRKYALKMFFTDERKKLEYLVGLVKDLQSRKIPVLIGTKTVYLSMKTAEILEQNRIKFNLLNALNNKMEAQIISKAGTANSITLATNMAGRGTDIKIDTESSKLGGLRVIQIEKNNSSRVDRQLFGRCARQGDPGFVHELISMDDPVFKTGAPFFLKMPVKRIRFLAFIPFLRTVYLWICQKNLERRAYRSRLSVLELDRWLKDNLNF